MRKLACHRLYVAAFSELSMQVVVLDENGRVQSWHHLEAEEPYVEWIGGNMILLPESCSPSDGTSLEQVWQKYGIGTSIPPYTLWRLSGVPLSGSDYSLPCKWRRLF